LGGKRVVSDGGKNKKKGENTFMGENVTCKKDLPKHSKNRTRSVWEKLIEGPVRRKNTLESDKRKKWTLTEVRDTLNSTSRKKERKKDTVLT